MEYRTNSFSLKTYFLANVFFFALRSSLLHFLLASKSNERGEYSYIGHGDFLIFRGLIFDFFFSSLHFFC